MYKGYRVRLLPTKEQEEKLLKKCDIARFVWNWCLDYQMKNFEAGNSYIKRFDMYKIFTAEKNTNEELAWLRDLAGSIINLKCADLDKAFNEYFAYRKAGGKKYSNKCKIHDVYHLIKHPKFKSKKKSTQRFPMRNDRLYFITENNITENWKKKYINHVNIENVGYVKFQTTFDTRLFIESKIWNPRISLVGDKWILSFTVETDENQVELNDYSCGVDVGIKQLAVVSCNDEIKKYENINKTNHLKKEQKRLKRLQRKFMKCEKDSKRREKAKQQYFNLSRHINNSRKNYIHNCSADIIKMKPNRIVVENISVRSWYIKCSHNINREIHFSNIYEFLRQLEYKSQNNKIKFVKADKYYPSTQLCSGCGNRQKLNLNQRVYICPVCGLEIDRDVNAAINLEHYNYK